MAGMAFLRSLWKAMDPHSTAPYIGRSGGPCAAAPPPRATRCLGFACSVGDSSTVEQRTLTPLI